MGNFLHRTTKRLYLSTSPNELPEILANYIEEPDLSGVVGVASIYWIITGDVITEMSAGEKTAVDNAMLSDSRDGAVQDAIDQVESIPRQLLLLMIDEINALRQQINATTAESADLTTTTLPDRTLAQVKTQIRNNLGS